MAHSYSRKIVVEQCNGYAQVAIGRLTRQGFWSVQNFKRGSKSDILTMFNKFYNHFVETDQNCEIVHLEVDTLSTFHAICNSDYFSPAT